MDQQQLSWAGPLAGTAETEIADVGTVAPPQRVDDVLGSSPEDVDPDEVGLLGALLS